MKRRRRERIKVGDIDGVPCSRFGLEHAASSAKSSPFEPVGGHGAASCMSRTLRVVCLIDRDAGEEAEQVGGHSEIAQALLAPIKAGGPGVTAPRSDVRLVHSRDLSIGLLAVDGAGNGSSRRSGPHPASTGRFRRGRELGRRDDDQACRG